MKKTTLLIILSAAFLLNACSPLATNKQIDFASPCACYEVETYTELKG